jgi:hypothetical protein
LIESLDGPPRRFFRPMLFFAASMHRTNRT